MSKIGKPLDRELFLPRSAKEVRWTLVDYPESLTCKFGPTNDDFFRETIFRPLGCWPLKFLHALEIVQAHTTNAIGCPQKNSKGEYLKNRA